MNTKKGFTGLLAAWICAAAAPTQASEAEFATSVTAAMQQTSKESSTLARNIDEERAREGATRAITRFSEALLSRQHEVGGRRISFHREDSGRISFSDQESGTRGQLGEPRLREDNRVVAEMTVARTGGKTAPESSMEVRFDPAKESVDFHPLANPSPGSEGQEIPAASAAALQAAWGGGPRFAGCWTSIDWCAAQTSWLFPRYLYSRPTPVCGWLWACWVY